VVLLLLPITEFRIKFFSPPENIEWRVVARCFLFYAFRLIPTLFKPKLNCCCVRTNTEKIWPRRKPSTEKIQLEIQKEKGCEQKTHSPLVNKQCPE
jgi:hypothetical protein